MECQFVWKKNEYHNEIPCNNLAKHHIRVTFHSNVFSGLYELGNKYAHYDICDEHYNLVKDDRNVTRLRPTQKRKQ